MLRCVAVDQIDGQVDCVSQLTARASLAPLLWPSFLLSRKLLCLGDGQGVRIETQKSRMAGSFKSYGMP